LTLEASEPGKEKQGSSCIRLVLLFAAIAIAVFYGGLAVYVTDVWVFLKDAGRRGR
jgi:hypothetical protein